MEIVAIAAGIIGAISGATLGTLLIKLVPPLKDRKFNFLIPVVLAVLFSQIIPRSGLQDYIMAQILPKNKYDRMVMLMGIEIMKNPAIKQALEDKSQPEQNALAQRFTREGLYWLPLEKLEFWNEFRLKMAEFSPSICSELFLGSPQPDEMKKFFESLDEKTVQEFIQLNVDAAVAAAEYNKELDIAQIQESIDKGFTSMLNKWPAKKKQRFAKAYQDTLKVNEKEACWVTKTIHTAIKNLKPDAKRDFLRAYAASI